ncbi:response regulator receiver protein [Candidatus Magnetomorum sp. HK-1]|nr:response regulator receiver protein [Candidatus Magnetomorum sp. HK-1]
MSEKKTILVVDDESDMVKYLTALFQDNGYETITAFDGVKGFDMAKSEKPDLITLDITMPEQSGVRTYRMYKDDPEVKAIPVIIVTAIGDTMHSFLKKLSGFSKPEGFMSKPIDPDELIKMVSGLLSD